MPRVTDFPIREVGPRRFTVDVPARHSSTGKPQRRVFTTRGRAEAEQDKLRKQRKEAGTSVALLPADAMADAARALELLGGHGATLTQAARAWVEAHARRLKSVPLPALEAEFDAMLKRNGRSEKYRYTVRWMLGRFRQQTGDVLTSDVTAAQAKAFLKPMTGASQKAHKRHLGAVFSYAVAEGYAAENVFSGLRTDEAKREPILALTSDESKALVEAADERIRPYLILATWCGIRRSELERLDWSEVNFDKGWVDIRQGTAKTGRRRLVELADNVVAMLKPLRKVSGPVVPVTRERLVILQRKARAAGKVERWQRHILRHTFASHWLTANSDDMDGLARQMGHTSTEIAHQHYLDAVDKADAIKFWGVGLPEESEGQKRPASETGEQAA